MTTPMRERRWHVPPDESCCCLCFVPVEKKDPKDYTLWSNEFQATGNQSSSHDSDFGHYVHKGCHENAAPALQALHPRDWTYVARLIATTLDGISPLSSADAWRRSYRISRHSFDQVSVTAMAHCSPTSRLTSLLLRVQALPAELQNMIIEYTHPSPFTQFVINEAYVREVKQRRSAPAPAPTTAVVRDSILGEPFIDARSVRAGTVDFPLRLTYSKQNCMWIDEQSVQTRQGEWYANVSPTTNVRVRTKGYAFFAFVQEEFISEFLSSEADAPVLNVKHGNLTSMVHYEAWRSICPIKTFRITNSTIGLTFVLRHLSYVQDIIVHDSRDGNLSDYARYRPEDHLVFQYLPIPIGSSITAFSVVGEKVGDRPVGHTVTLILTDQSGQQRAQVLGRCDNMKAWSDGRYRVSAFEHNNLVPRSQKVTAISVNRAKDYDPTLRLALSFEPKGFVQAENDWGEPIDTFLSGIRYEDDPSNDLDFVTQVNVSKYEYVQGCITPHDGGGWCIGLLFSGAYAGDEVLGQWRWDYPRSEMLALPTNFVLVQVGRHMRFTHARNSDTSSGVAVNISGMMEWHARDSNSFVGRRDLE